MWFLKKTKDGSFLFFTLFYQTKPDLLFFTLFYQTKPDLLIRIF